MNKSLLALYGLEWNPFSPALPTEALLTTAALGARRGARRGACLQPVPLSRGEGQGFG